MILREGTTIGNVAKKDLPDLEWLIHGGVEDVRQAAKRASRADIIAALRHCSMNPEGNKTRRAVLETALRNHQAKADAEQILKGKGGRAA